MTALAIPETTRAELSETALVLDPGLSFQEWEEVGHALGRASRASAWWIGDWVNFGEKNWGEKYKEAERLTGFSYQYLAQCAAVAKRFQFIDRSINLTWSHHYKALPLPDADEWIAEAESKGWSVRELVERSAPLREKRSARSSNVMPQKRHKAVVDSADSFVKTSTKWTREMTDALSPPEARKQLTVLNKAAARLAEVIEAVEYRADTLATFNGR